MAAISGKESCEREVCRSCELDEKSYIHGSEVRKGALAIHCVDGQWRGRVDPFVTFGP